MIAKFLLLPVCFVVGVAGTSVEELNKYSNHSHCAFFYFQVFASEIRRPFNWVVCAGEKGDMPPLRICKQSRYTRCARKNYVHSPEMKAISHVSMIFVVTVDRVSHVLLAAHWPSPGGRSLGGAHRLTSDPIAKGE